MLPQVMQQKNKNVTLNRSLLATIIFFLEIIYE